MKRLHPPPLPSDIKMTPDHLVHRTAGTLPILRGRRRGGGVRWCLSLWWRVRVGVYVTKEEFVLARGWSKVCAGLLHHPPHAVQLRIVSSHRPFHEAVNPSYDYSAVFQHVIYISDIYCEVRCLRCLLFWNFKISTEQFHLRMGSFP